MLKRRGHGLELDRPTGSVLVGAPAAFDGPLGEAGGGAKVGRRDQQLEPDEPAGLNAWAVGYYSNGAPGKTLIEHWNGTTWTQVPSPNPDSSSNALLGVAATSASNAWAVGSYSFSQTLAMHYS